MELEGLIDEPQPFFQLLTLGDVLDQTQIRVAAV
jgi:hypothetical protein